MTDPVVFARSEEPLPGLGDPGPHANPLRLAAHRSLTALEGAGYLDDRHAVVCQLILDLADSIDAGRRHGRASAVAMAAAQLLAAFELLTPEESGGDTGDQWSDFMAEIRRSATEVRHTADPGPPV